MCSRVLRPVSPGEVLTQEIHLRPEGCILVVPGDWKWHLGPGEVCCSWMHKARLLSGLFSEDLCGHCSDPHVLQEKCGHCPVPLCLAHIPHRLPFWRFHCCIVLLVRFDSKNRWVLLLTCNPVKAIKTLGAMNYSHFQILFYLGYFSLSSEFSSFSS